MEYIGYDRDIQESMMRGHDTAAKVQEILIEHMAA